MRKTAGGRKLPAGCLAHLGSKRAIGLRRAQPGPDEQGGTHPADQAQPLRYLVKCQCTHVIAHNLIVDRGPNQLPWLRVYGEDEAAG